MRHVNRRVWAILLALGSMSLLVSPPAAAAPSPIPPSATLFHEGFETFAPGPIAATGDPAVQVSTFGRHVWANVTGERAAFGAQSLKIEDKGAGPSDDIYVHVNATPAVAPPYVASLWYERGSAPGQDTGSSGFALLGNSSSSANSAAYDRISQVVVTGSVRVAGCPASSICAWNGTRAAYDPLGPLAYDTWYHFGWRVAYDAVAGVARYDLYLNGSLHGSSARAIDIGNGLRGCLHGFLFFMSPEGRATAYVDELSVTRTLADVPSDAYAVPASPLTPDLPRIDFADARYVQAMTNLTPFAYAGPQEWTTVKAHILEPGCAACQDSASASQGVLYVENGTSYFFYSMRGIGSSRIRAIGLAISRDGLNFTRTTANGAGPATGVVMWNGTAGQLDAWDTYAPTAVIKARGVYVMIYTGTGARDGGGAHYYSFLATSTNLTWWRHRYDLKKVLLAPPFGSDCFGDATIAGVGWDPLSALYKAVVQCKATETGATRTLHTATSPDLVNWTMDPMPSGRIFPESTYHLATVWRRNGLWYLLYNRFRMPPQADLQWGLAISRDGLAWLDTKWTFLAERTVPGTGVTTAGWACAGVFFVGDRIRLYPQGFGTGGSWTTAIERPIDRLIGLQLRPGVVASGNLTTQPLVLGAGISRVNVNVNVPSGGRVTVQVLDASGAARTAESDGLTSSGANLTVTWSGSPDLALPGGTYAFAIRMTPGSGGTPRLFGVGWVSELGPRLTLTSPVPGEVLANTTVLVSWNATDSPPGPLAFSVRLDLGGWASAGSNLSFTLVNVSAGAHTVSVMAQDSAGRAAVKTVDFLVDLSPPTLTIVSPTNGTIVPVADIVLQWTRPRVRLAAAQVDLDGAGWIQVDPNATTYVFVGVPDGNHTASVQVADTSGRNATASVQVVVDARYFNASIASPSDGALLNRSWVQVTWTTNADLGSLQAIDVYVDGVYAADATGQPGALLTNLTEGPHAILVVITDFVGNEASASVNLTVDTVPPTVRILAPAWGDTFASGTVNVTWTAADATSGVAYAEVAVDGGIAMWVGLANSITLPGLLPGTHEVTVLVTDGAGNVGAANVTFAVRAAPTPSAGGSPTGGVPWVLVVATPLAAACLVALAFIWHRTRSRKSRFAPRR